MKILSLILSFALLALFVPSVQAESLVYQGEAGPGKGKHIVFMAGDHEYRSEETLPALARILAKHHGFKCTVLFNINKNTGFIEPGNNNMPGTEVLESADLVIMMMRFQNLPKEQMEPFLTYLKSGKPIMGFRTSTHAFNIPSESEFAKYSWNYKGEDYEGGFGRQVLGETWVKHYGDNHKMSTRLDIIPEMAKHSILTGVKSMWVKAGGYYVEPMQPCDVLANAQPLVSMKEDAEPAPDKKPCPGVWTRTYKSPSGKEARVFTTTYGASEDILNEGFRRCLVNASFWSLSMEKEIKPDLEISFVGPYHPCEFRFDGYRKEMKPQDMAGWDTPISDPKKVIRSSRKMKR